MGAVIAGLLLAQPPNQPIGTGRYLESSSNVVAGYNLTLDPDQRSSDHCALINSVACDTAEFEVQLQTPAASVIASVDGRVMSLWRIAKPTGAETVSFRAGTAFAGNLNPPETSKVFPHRRTETMPSKGVVRTHLPVRLSIDYPDGSRVITRFRSVATRCWTGAVTANDICSR
jgi:hypothetical protein